MTTPDTRPTKPTPDFPLFAHGNGQWCKKVNGKLRYFGPWSNPQAALGKYLAENGQKLTNIPAAPVIAKPSKPFPGYPLYAHNVGQWAKKIRGKVHYFGPWADPQAALEKYVAEKDALLAGRAPAPAVDGLAVEELANLFLYSKELLVQEGRIKQRTWDDYHMVCARVVKLYGNRVAADLTPTDFETLRGKLAKSRGPVAIGNDINRVRILFKWGYDQGHLDRPMRFGQGFAKPSRKVLRQERAKKGLLMFEAADLRRMLDSASKPLKAMILLGVNGGFGNTDVGTLPFSAVNLKTGWINYPRPKTSIPRRIPLWPETIAALQAAIDARPKPKPEYRKRVFVTSNGDTWERTNNDNPVSKETAKLLKKLGLHRPGLNFYSLRRTFETVGGESKDQVAVDAIMGHAPDQKDMAAVYRQTVSDGRLRAVTDFVREWLFGSMPLGPADGAPVVVGPP